MNEIPKIQSIKASSKDNADWKVTWKSIYVIHRAYGSLKKPVLNSL